MKPHPDPFALLWPRPQRLTRRSGACAANAQPRILLGGDPGLRASGYRLRAGAHGIEIDAADESGVRNASRTLAQIVRLLSSEGSLPAFEIEDWPDFPRRGVMLDVSRGRVPRMETLISLIEWLASLKIDEVQLYTEHTFAYRGHEEVWSAASPLTPDEVRALAVRCKDLGVDLVPNQQSLGHMHRWLSHERYRSLAEVPEGVDHAFSLRREPFSLCPTDPASLTFLAELYDQLLPCFESRSFNVGLDEAFDIGLGRSRAACESRGKGRVYVDFLRQVAGLARDRGRRIQFWADGILQHPELHCEIPSDATALVWGYEAGHPFAREASALAQTGLAFYVCPGTSSWQSVAGRTANAAANLASAALHGREARAAGYLVTDWGDRGHLQPMFASLPGFLLGAGFGWNASAAEDADIDLAALLDAHAFDDSPGALDSTGVLGRAAVDLGNAYLESGCASTNGSALFFLLAFASQPLPHERMPGLSIEGLERARLRLRDVRARLEAARGDRERIVAEMCWAADLLEFACGFGIARLRTPPGSPVQAIEDSERRRLGATLAPLVSGHRDLWLSTCRPGGLAESMGWLERVQALLD
jgi:hexosaminidase